MNNFVVMFFRTIRPKMAIFKVLVILILLIILRKSYWIPKLNRRTVAVEDNCTRDITTCNQETILRNIDQNIEKGLEEDKGTGCEIPKTDPFSEEVRRFNKELRPIRCFDEEWVTCYLSKCKVNEDVVDNINYLECTYRDILFYDDYRTKFGPSVKLKGYHEYNLTESDHVEVVCKNYASRSRWRHHLGGIRTLEAPETPVGRNNSYNVLFFGYDSTSKNGFIRKMPKSLQYIRNELKATVLESYHVVGDGTTAALFPILTGKREIEHPDFRKTISKKKVDHEAFIFYKMRKLGYRTLYMEDFGAEGPTSGTFQRRFNGFAVPPADHYLRNLLIEDYRRGVKLEKTESGKWTKKKHCFGNIPQYQYMINITDQFLQLPGKKFSFTFISHITHDDFNMIAEADQPTVDFLKGIVERGLLKNTLIFIMGDHGTRFGGIRSIYQGKLEERLPFMAIRLPDELTAKRPDAVKALVANSDGVLTTPHDIYATVMDVLDLSQNPYKVKGSDLKRGMTLLQPIPRNRSCSEAGIEPHWCVCLKWERLNSTDPMYFHVAKALINKINSMTLKLRSQCALRTIVSIDWVYRKRPHQKMLDFFEAKDRDRYFGVFKPNAPMPEQSYEVKITVDPGKSVFESIVTYNTNQRSFKVTPSDITRSNAYRNEPACISAVHPELNIYCFCT